MVELFDYLSARNPFAHVVQYLVAVCNRPEGASDVISGQFVRQIVLEKFVKCGHPRLNRSREIPLEAVGSGIFDSFCYNFQPEVDSDVISGVAIDFVGYLCKIL